MTPQEAQDVIMDGLQDADGAEITTTPTAEQLEALDVLSGSLDLAPQKILRLLDLNQGRMWMEVVAVIRADLEDAREGGEADQPPA